MKYDSGYIRWAPQMPRAVNMPRAPQARGDPKSGASWKGGMSID